MIFLAAHLFGDLLLQNHWMQKKSVDSFVCSVHVAFYSLPWLLLVFFGHLALWQVGLIIAQHWLQDRYGLHLKWMKLYKQTPTELWAVGPLCMDQAMHLSFIALVISL